jgi:hypothetical protein
LNVSIWRSATLADHQRPGQDAGNGEIEQALAQPIVS